VRLWPYDKRDWLLVLLVAPLPLWTPVGLGLLLVPGPQDGGTGEGATIAITVGTVTVMLFVLAVFGLLRIDVRRRS
jgi:hypothetical protein